MKKTNLFLCVPALVLAGVLATLNSGCGKKPAPPGEQRPAGKSPASTVVSVEKTSFTEVTSQLDAGGNFYLYLGTAQWVEHLSTKVEAWRKPFTAMPDAKPEDVQNINKAFDLVTRLITDSGVEDVTGVGLSSVEIEPGLYRNKALLHHYPGKGGGFLWKLGGRQPHPLTGLDLLPDNTALAVFSDVDMPLLWSVIQDEAGKSGFPQAQDFLQKLPAQFEQGTKLNWDLFLKSIGGEFGFVVTLNDSNSVPIPLPTGLVQIPEPGIMLVVKVNDDAIFNRIADELKKNQQVISVETNGTKMRIMPLPLPFAINVRPTAASSGGYLFIASSDQLVKEALAVKAGEKPGLKNSAEFKRLGQGIPDTGNQFSYVSKKLGVAILTAEKQIITAQVAGKNGAGGMDFINSFLRADRAQYSYSVGQNTPDGCLTVGNGSQSAASLVALPAAAMVGMMSAIAIPNFVKARATSQQNACINNLRQLDTAKNQWALEKSKTADAMPTKEDLLPYLYRWPVCPAGGTYTLGPVSESPKCSIPGHALP